MELPTKKENGGLVKENGNLKMENGGLFEKIGFLETELKEID